MPRKPPERHYTPEETRRVLMEAALELFAEQGFRDTTMQEVAVKAGVTKGAFYYHFQTKEEALRIIHDEFIDRALESQHRALANYASPTEQLARMAYDITMVCIEFQKHVKVFFREQHILGGEIRDTIMAKRRESTRIFQDVLRRGIDAGEFSDALDPDVAALGLLGMWVWSYQWYRPGGGRTPVETARQFTTMTLQSLGVKETADSVL